MTTRARLALPDCRYLLVSSHYAPLYQFGGPVRLAEQYALTALSAGLMPTVLTIASQRELREAVGRSAGSVSATPGTTVVHALDLDRNSTLALLRAIPSGLRATWQHLQGAQRVVLHICEYRAPLTLGAALALRAWHMRHPRQSIHILHSAFGQLQPPTHPAKAFYDYLFRAITRRMRYTVLAQNQHEFDIARRFFAGHDQLRVDLLPLSTDGDPACTADTSPAQLRERRARARAALGLSGDTPVLIFLGRWVAEKGIERLLRAVAALPSSLQPVLLVAGADFGIGPRLRELAESLTIAGRVRFLENISTQRFDLYAAADVFTALPIVHEETMLASVEALSVGTPILVSREADIPYVSDAGAGSVIDFAQPQFEQALLTLLANHEHASSQARNTYLQWFAGGELRRQLLGLLGDDRPAVGPSASR